jgi:hypothetical protein
MGFPGLFSDSLGLAVERIDWENDPRCPRCNDPVSPSWAESHVVCGDCDEARS